MLTVIIDSNDQQKDGIVTDIQSRSVTSIPEHFNGDNSVEIHIREVVSLDGSATPYIEADKPGDIHLVAIGNLDDTPSGGTFTVTIAGTPTSALQYDSTAAQLQTAISAASVAAGKGAVAVTILPSGALELVWGTAGAVSEVVVDGTYLRPVCEVSVDVFRAGSISQFAMQTIRIKRAAVASATVSTPFVSDGCEIVTTPPIGTSTNAIAEIFWDDAYAGTSTSTLTANGIDSVITLSPTMTLEEIGTAFTSHPSIRYQTPGEDDNIAVTRIDDTIRVEFIGTQSAASLARTIAINSAADPTVIETSTQHGFASGQSVTIPENNGSSDSIAGTHTITVISSTEFSIPVDCTGGGGTGGTVYTTSQPALTFISDADLIYPKGNTGTLSFATEALAREFMETTDDELGFVFQVKRLRGATETTILSAPVTLNRNLLDGATLSAPSGIVSAFVKKTDLGTNVFTALGVAVGSAGAFVTFNGAGGTPSSLTLTNATGLPVAGGGTGRATSTTAYGLIAAGTTATAAHQTLAAGATTQLLVGGGASALPVWTTATGSGSPVRGTSPTITTPVITNIVPGADFTITQNSVSAMTIVSASAVVDTLTLKAGKVGIGTNNPTEVFQVANGNDNYTGFNIKHTGASGGNFLLVATSAAHPNPSSFGFFDNVAGAYRMRITSDGTIVFAGALVGSPQALSGAGAVNLTTICTDFTSTGAAQALTLANGTVGQIKTITHIVDGGSGVLTPTTKTGYTTITFTNAGDSVTLRYCTTAGWCVIGSFGVTIA